MYIMTLAAVSPIFTHTITRSRTHALAHTITRLPLEGGGRWGG